MGNGSCSLATLWSSAKRLGELDWLLTATAVASSPRWVAGKWARAHWLLVWRIVVEEILGGDAAVGKGAETPLQQISWMCHPFRGCKLRTCLHLEERWQPVTEQLWNRIAAAARIREMYLHFWCPSRGNYREGRRDVVVMTKQIMTVEVTVHGKLTFNIIWGMKPCASLSPSSSVSDQRWKPSRRWN